MTDNPANFKPAPLDALRRYVPLAAWAIVILTILMIPLRIIQYGYLPGDDALRHAAKAVSGKPWDQILVLGDAFKIDHNLGWHSILAHIHQWTNWNTESLVIFTVVALFTISGWAVIPWLKRPEAWLVALMASMIVSDIPQRFLLGRPFLLTITALMTILLAWQKHGSSPPKWWNAIWMALLIAFCSFVHGVWYLWALPVAAFFLAGQFRWCFLLAAGWIGGTLLAGLLSGHPVEFVMQAFDLAFRSVGKHTTQRTMVTELQPTTGDILALILFGGLLVLRQLSRMPARPLASNPAFWLACLCWILGFRVGRFWEDWGWPALMILIACDLELLLQSRLAVDSFKRLGIVCGLAAASFLCLTSDLNNRWSAPLTNQYLSEAEHPDDLKGWMPEKGGILYSADMTIFYQTFFKNPNGDWRYILGFESTFMPEADFEVYHKVLWNFGDSKAYEPWVEKMQPADRLVIRGGRGNVPNIPQLDWNYGVSGIWIGRLPRNDTNSAPTTIPATKSRENSIK